MVIHRVTFSLSLVPPSCFCDDDSVLSVMMIILFLGIIARRAGCSYAYAVAGFSFFWLSLLWLGIFLIFFCRIVAV